MYQVKTIIKAGKPAFEVRRYAANFKSSVIIGETDTYEKANDAVTWLSQTFPIISTHAVDPTQLSIEPLAPAKNGK